MPRLPALLPFTLALLVAACQPADDGATVEDESARASIVSEPATLGEEPAATGVPDLDDAVCNADLVQEFVGQQLTDALINQALKASGASIPRVLGPNTPATLDLSHSRLNILTDDNGVIQSLHCG